MSRIAPNRRGSRGGRTGRLPADVRFSRRYWFKQDEIHDGTHVHICPAFLPWHRELVSRFEAMLREIDPELSMHYWGWTADPQALTDSDGNALNLLTPDRAKTSHYQRRQAKHNEVLLE